MNLENLKIDISLKMFGWLTKNPFFTIPAMIIGVNHFLPLPLKLSRSCRYLVQDNVHWTSNFSVRPGKWTNSNPI